MPLTLSRRLVGTALITGLGFAAGTANASGTATVTGTAQGVTPFIGAVSATIGGATLISVTTTVQPIAGSYTRPLIAQFSTAYLARTGRISGTQVTVPLTFLYAARANTIALLFKFTDGSSVTTSTSISTPTFSSTCAGLATPNIQQNRTSIADLGFDYFILKDYCSNQTPVIVDTDGQARWVGTANTAVQDVAFYQNSVYSSNGGTGINRINLDGTIQFVTDLASAGVTGFHHNIDPGRDGLIIDVNTTTQTESVNIEFSPKTGAILNRWDLADIISAAMVAGGDDPSNFVFPVGTDWFHNNATTYNKADNTLIVSSRENFVIAVDYDTPADGVKKIHWILGDPTKHWAQYASLRKYALTIANGAPAPIGQHAVSIDHLGNVLLFNDGGASFTQQPAGASRSYSIGQAFKIDTVAMTATQTINYTDYSKSSYICGSFYEGYPGYYLIDYAQEQAGNTELRGIGTRQKVVFDIKYPLTGTCAEAWNSAPIKGHTLVFH